ncbi:MAG TPA: hypothetical protein VF178_13435 [Gemmatimonadaceae bacterium]
MMVLLLAIFVMLLVVPVTAVLVTRSVLRSMDMGAATARPVAIEDRLTRIEEAIDAMAQQIERLTEQQRALLGGAAVVESDPTEVPGRATEPA